jgi:hypothetical protein
MERYVCLDVKQIKTSEIMKYCIFTSLDLRHLFFQINDALEHELTELGHEVYQTSNLDVQDCDAIILMSDIRSEDVEGFLINNAHMSYILYVTEPFNVMPIKKVQRFSYIVRRFPPECIWTYSHANIKKIRQLCNVPVYYCPPGYSIAYDYSIDQSHTIPLKYYTVINHASDRRIQLIKEQIDVENVSCWTHTEWAEKMKNMILVNVHKIVGDERSALEMLRIAPVLSNGVSIVSENSDIDDMKTYDTFITFTSVESFKDLVIKKVDVEKYKRNFAFKDILHRCLNAKLT